MKKTETERKRMAWRDMRGAASPAGWMSDEQLEKCAAQSPFKASKIEREVKLANASPALLAACKAVVKNWETGDLAAAARLCSWQVTAIEGKTVQLKPIFTVILKYPDYMCDGNCETWVSSVEAMCAAEAVRIAQKECATDTDNPHSPFDLDDYLPISVFEGRHQDLISEWACANSREQAI